MEKPSNYHLKLNFHIDVLCRCLLLSTLVSVVSACGLSNLQLEQTNTELNALNEKVEASQASTSALLENVELMLAKQSEMEPQLLALRHELNSIKANQSEIRNQMQRDDAPSEVAAQPELELGSDKVMLGRVEWLWLTEAERYFAAQINSWLDLSIIYADDAMVFERDGERWLSFTVERNDWPSTIAAKVIRSDRLQHIGGNSLRGNVVSLPVQMAGFSDELEFVVIDKNQKYPQIILGQNFLTDVAVVDVSEKYLHKKDPEAVRAEAEKRDEFEQSQIPPENPTPTETAVIETSDHSGS